MFESLLADLRLALRSVARDRGFTLVAAFTIALGVGATAGVLSIANAALAASPRRAGAGSGRGADGEPRQD